MMDFETLLWLCILAALGGLLLLFIAAGAAIARHPDPNDPKRSSKLYTYPAGIGFIVALVALCGILLAVLGLWLT